MQAQQAGASLKLTCVLPMLLQAIEDMPAEESPEVFGLHANADLTFRTLQARDRLQIFRDTRPAEASRKGGASREDVVDKMAEELLAKVCAAPTC